MNKERLKHSPNGYIRALQMTSAQVVAYVEGKSDVYFYDKICASVCDPIGVPYQVRKAVEAPVEAEGKNGLLSFFEFLSANNLLSNELLGKKVINVFFADKDLDDIMQVRKQNAHLIYTKYYSFENHVYKEANIVEVIASAISANSTFIASQLGSSDQCLSAATQVWKDWVKLCVYSTVRKTYCGSNYGATSQINKPEYGPVNQQIYQQFLSRLLLASHLSNNDFASSFTRISDFVDNLYMRGQQDRIYNGKWYPYVLERQLKSLATMRGFDIKGIHSKLLPIAQARLDYKQHWAEHFKSPLRSLVSTL